jgi:hypothetical protein
MATDTRTARPLADLLEYAQRAQAKGGHHRSDGTFVPAAGGNRIAGANATLGMRTLLPDVIDADGRPTGLPAYTRASDVIDLGTAMIRSSVALSMGATLIELPEGVLRTDPNGEPVLAEHPGGFDVVSPAPFTALALTGSGTDAEAEVATSAMPIRRAEIDRANTEQLAVRFAIPRSALRDYGHERIEAQLLASIAAGAGQALDGLLLRALAQATGDGVVQGAEVVHAIAGRTGVRFAELGAIIGQNSATPDLADDRLLIGGVHAEHSAGAAHTIAGVFDRAAIAVSPEIEVLAERHGVDGGLVLTAWLDAQPLIPAPEYFEEVGDDQGA